MSSRLHVVNALLVAVGVAACSTGLEIDSYRNEVADARAEPDVVVIDAAVADVLVADVAVVDAVVGPMNCDGPDAEWPTSSIVAPDREAYLAAVAPLGTQQINYPGVLELPLSSCPVARFVVGNVIGSAFLDMVRADNGDCEIWTGGFEEFPEYNGLPTQYCRFPASCGHLSVPSNMWGGLAIDSPWCVPSGFCVDCPELTP